MEYVHDEGEFSTVLMALSILEKSSTVKASGWRVATGGGRRTVEMVSDLMKAARAPAD